MAQPIDVSSDHFEWLVTNRSRNQQITLDLYKLINARGNKDILSRNTVLQSHAQDLVAVTFSLWRAVFLTDLSGKFEDQLTDANTFLQSLIAHNTVLYQTDFNARAWSFEYYMDNALLRLKDLHRTLGYPKTFHLRAKTAKDEWVAAQTRLETYVRRFETLLATEGADRV